MTKLPFDLKPLVFSAVCALGVSQMPARADPVAVPLSAEDVLEPYVARLPGHIAMPRAGPNAELAPDTIITTIAFGSCNQQTGSQAFWGTIAAQNPQAFLYIGDNVYGDTGWDGGADLASLREAYRVLAARPEFTGFRSKVPMLATWDDHDYGLGDGGMNFAFRRVSEQIFETFWNSSEDVRKRDGVYFSRIYGRVGQRTQIIMLDTRFFRSNWRAPGFGEDRPRRGNYLPNTDPSATMLGDQQWTWLQGELARPAEFRILVSSIQVISKAHNFEGWAMMPLEREKLLSMVRARAGGGLLIVSGDRHAGGVYRIPGNGSGDAIYEITSSSLNKPVASTAKMTADEPDPNRMTPFFGEANFGQLDIDWKARAVTTTLRGDKGEIRDRTRLAF